MFPYPHKSKVEKPDKTAEKLENFYDKLPRIVRECLKVAIGERTIMDHEPTNVDLNESRPNPNIAHGTHSQSSTNYFLASIKIIHFKSLSYI